MYSSTLDTQVLLKTSTSVLFLSRHLTVVLLLVLEYILARGIFYSSNEAVYSVSASFYSHAKSLFERNYFTMHLMKDLAIQK